MKISALLTSAGINIGLCVLFWSLYSVLRKQPTFVRVYFGQRIAEERRLLREAFILERFVPSTGWIVKALQCTEEEILAAAGLDAVAFNRMLVFSIRTFSLAAILCLFGILPLHYFGRNMHHLEIPSEQLHIFTVGNVEVQSRWLWVHCVVLYIISGVACIFLYLEYRHIARLRLLHLKRATPNPGQFTVLVRGIPKTTKESCSSDIGDFFTKYHASSYLFHQVAYKVGKVQKIMLLNVYRMRYDTGGLYWPIAHNTVIFSLVLTQIICLGVFGLKRSPVAAGFTIPLIFFILVFNQYCRTQFLHLFKTFPAQDLIDMDREDERSGRMEHIHHGLRSAYRQFPDAEDIKLEKILTIGNDEDQDE
ncbi:hypothetical protein ACQ4PT_015373 [Festuca glaucescens]